MKLYVEQVQEPEFKAREQGYRHHPLRTHIPLNLPAGVAEGV